MEDKRATRKVRPSVIDGESYGCARHEAPGVRLGINLAAAIMALHRGRRSIASTREGGTNAELILPQTSLNL